MNMNILTITKRCWPILRKRCCC